MRWAAVACSVLVAATGCASGARKALDVPLGTSRADAVSVLRAHEFCRPEGRMQAIENYPRCDQVGLELSESWVVARYDREGKLERLTRYERQRDETAAAERWEALITEGRKTRGAESEDAKKRAGEMGDTPEGAIAWVAWFVQGSAAIDVLYLVRAASPKTPNIVEDVRWVPAPEED